MENLEEIRERIDAIDKEMAALFEKRMQAAKDVAAYKAEHGLPVFDGAREAAVIERNGSYVSSAQIRAYYTNFLSSLMDLSKKYQRELMEGLRIAYSGVEGAFAQIAASKIFPSGQLVSYPSFSAAYSAVSDGECDVAVLPIENSYAGEVGQVTDLMFEGSLHVNGVYDLLISQNLLALPGARIEDVKTVVSHPQALAQCAKYIAEHGFAQLQSANTAIAAQQVAQTKDPSLAAIASAETARLYGLCVLDHDINESAGNTTRFAVFSRSALNDDAHNQNFLLLFTVNHVAGALSDALHVISKYGFNMKALRSRPVKTAAWQYYFYVEAEGDDRSESGIKMLEELRQHCNRLKVVGRFAGETTLTKE